MDATFGRRACWEPPSAEERHLQMDLPDTNGLSAALAAERLAKDGPNALPEPERRGMLATIGRVLREPMLLLLVAASGVYLLLGDAGEAALLSASVLIVIGLTIHQERKAERALQALRAMGSPRAHVVRDGSQLVIDSRDVVVGDLLLIAEGDRLVADARLFEAIDIQVDTSLLTGESVPVAGLAGSIVHAGSLVVRGHGRASVVATGAATEMGRIGTALHGIRVEVTPMQRQMRRIVALFAALSLLACVAMVVLYGIARDDWLQAWLAGLTLAIATIPEEFPVVLAVFLALGAWRMARHAALVRRASAIEAMGAITVLCTDKTGTLTENRMAVASLVAPGEDAVARAETPSQRRLLQVAALACPVHSYDPMDRALQEAATAAGVRCDHGMRNREYPFSPELPVLAIAWRTNGDASYIACKGAPEAVAALCGLPSDAHLATVQSLATRGLRVLAVAEAIGGAEDDADLAGHSFTWIGLVAFADPLRNGVSEAVAEAQAAGIRVLMLTGDHAATALAIANEAGITCSQEVVEGASLEALDAAKARETVARANVFARVKPRHKLRLIDALKAGGEIVAMTGDGVNDAPALAASHVGIAMGGRGTDVAREAAAIVLLDDNFVTIVRAIQLGRTVYDNILRAVRYILAVHVPITGLALLPLATGSPLVLLPLHVVFLELIIDPACSIVLEREPPAADLMRRPPRRPTQPLLAPAAMLLSLGQGAAIFLIVALVQVVAMRAGLPASQAGALAFSALVSGNLGLLLLYREGSTMSQLLLAPNPAFWSIVAGAMLILGTVTWIPAAATWLGFQRPPFVGWLLALSIPVLLVMAMKRRDRHGAHPPAVRP
jgi:P-type Ca2+ transporter type 2C